MGRILFDRPQTCLNDFTRKDVRGAHGIAVNYNADIRGERTGREIPVNHGSREGSPYVSNA